MATKFRNVEKRPLAVSVPVEVTDALTLAAAQARMPRPEFVTRILASAIGLDVADFGLDPQAEPLATR